MTRNILKLAAFVAAGFAAHTAGAQQFKFCGNNLVAISAYSERGAVPGGGAVVQYHGVFKNQDQSHREMKIILNEVAKVGAHVFVTETRQFDLSPGRERKVYIATTHTPNANGTGAPTMHQVMDHLRLTCSYY